MGMYTDYFENKLIDLMFRGQAYTLPATWYMGLLTAAPSDSTPGTEVVGAVGYARVPLAATLANWASTQGNAVASTGNTGTTSNLVAVTFGAPSGNWGVVGWWGAYDAASGGNLCIYGTLSQSKTINNGDAAPSFAVGQLSLQIDN